MNIFYVKISHYDQLHENSIVVIDISYNNTLLFSMEYK